MLMSATMEKPPLKQWNTENSMDEITIANTLPCLPKILFIFGIMKPLNMTSSAAP